MNIVEKIFTENIPEERILGLKQKKDFISLFKPLVETKDLSYFEIESLLDYILKFSIYEYDDITVLNSIYKHQKLNNENINKVINIEENIEETKGSTERICLLIEYHKLSEEQLITLLEHLEQLLIWWEAKGRDGGFFGRFSSPIYSRKFWKLLYTNQDVSENVERFLEENLDYYLEETISMLNQ